MDTTHLSGVTAVQRGALMALALLPSRPAPRTTALPVGIEPELDAALAVDG